MVDFQSAEKQMRHFSMTDRDKRVSNLLKLTLTETVKDSMASIMILPIELVYRILNHLDLFEILVSMRNVCQRLDQIVDTYDQYQVNEI